MTMHEERNAEIVCCLLSIGGETADYAAARIEELELHNQLLRDRLDAIRAFVVEKGGG